MFLWLKSSLKRKLAIIFSAINIVMIAAVATFSYSHTSKTIRQDVEQYSKQILGQANLNLARYYRDNELFFKTIASSKEFRLWVLTTPKGRYSLISLMMDIQDRYIKPYTDYHSEIMSVVLYNENGNESIYRSPEPDLAAILRPDFSLGQEKWLDKLDFSTSMVRFVNKPKRYWDEFGKPLDIPVMTFAQKFQFMDQTGYLMMDISLEPTNDILQAIASGKKGSAMISDETGNLIASPDSAQIATPLNGSLRKSIMRNDEGHFFDPESKNLVVYESVPGSNWKMILNVPYQEVMFSSNVVRNFTLTVALICLLGGLIIVIWVSDSITKRIKVLGRTIKSTEMGRFDIRVADNGVDEVAGLAKSYNHLLGRIENSIMQLTESKLMHQKAILSALQSQINSHFLYNALESINSMANIAGHSEIQQTAISLSKLLRYTSNYSQTFVKLRDEIRSLNDYMQIITILYGDHITYHIDVQPGLEDTDCLKALLQPVVENCIKHGYEIKGELLHIGIRIELLDEMYLRITVEDNGPGFDTEKLSRIRSRLEHKEPEKEFNQLDRVGLLNLHYRLKMVYPDERTGVSIPEKKDGKGTVIQICFPCRKENV